DDFLAPLSDDEREALHASLLRLAEVHEPRCAPLGVQAAAAARSSSALSIFPISSIAAITRCALSRSGSASSSGRRFGTTCQERPKRSLSQPHGPGSPPTPSFSQEWSTSSWPRHGIWNEIASLNVKFGPPLRARNFWPSSSKVTVIT